MATIGVGMNAQTVGAGLTRYFGLCEPTAQAGSTIQTPPLPACSITRVTCAISGAQPGDGSLVVTITNVDTTSTLVLTIASGSAAGAYSATGTLSFSAADRVGISVTNNATSASATITSIDCSVDIAGVIIPVSPSVNIASGATRYFQPLGTNDRATESDVHVSVPVACTLTQFYGRTRSANGDTQPLVLTVRKNAADETSLQLTWAASEAAATKSATGASIAFAAGDKLAIKGVKSGGTDSAILAGLTIVGTVP